MLIFATIIYKRIIWTCVEFINWPTISFYRSIHFPTKPSLKLTQLLTLPGVQEYSINLGPSHQPEIRIIDIDTPALPGSGSTIESDAQILATIVDYLTEHRFLSRNPPGLTILCQPLLDESNNSFSKNSRVLGWYRKLFTTQEVTSSLESNPILIALTTSSWMWAFRSVERI